MININKFLIFSFAYFILGIVSFSLFDSILISNDEGFFVLFLFVYIFISGIWSIIDSSVKKFLITSLFYVVFTRLLSYDADENMFGPSREQTILIAVIAYAIFILIWFGVKFFKKKYKKQM